MPGDIFRRQGRQKKACGTAATLQDVPALKIYYILFPESRYNDRTREDADRLYRAWIENSVKARLRMSFSISGKGSSAAEAGKIQGDCDQEGKKSFRERIRAAHRALAWFRRKAPESP
jgi:hypothetical protein